MIGILALILQIVMIVIIFSLPGRFREQREHMERQKREITDKLYALQKTQDELLRLVEACRKTTPQHRAIRKTIEQLDRVGGPFRGRPLTPPCVPFGTRRFNRLSASFEFARTSVGYSCILLVRAFRLLWNILVLGFLLFASNLAGGSPTDRPGLARYRVFLSSSLWSLVSSIVSRCTS